MSKRLLTIGICTYNRNDMLARVVANLIPQLDAACEILLLDNGSDIPVVDTLRATFSADELQQVRVVRLKYNVGAPMLRCLEECETDWMWGLNDKAEVRPDGVQTVLECIRDNSDCILINFTPYQREAGLASPKRHATVKTLGQLDLVDNVIDYGSSLDYMANVYHVPSYAKSYGAAYIHGGPGSGQFAIVLHAVGNDRYCLLSDRTPVERPPTDPSLRWSQLDYLSTYMLPLDLVTTEEGRSKLTRDILAFLPSRKYFVVKLLYLSLADRVNARYYFRLYQHMMLHHDGRVSTRLFMAIGSILMLFPGASLAALEPISQFVFKRNLRDAI